MNCPGGILIYKDKPRSYKELPLNFQKRFSKRVRQFINNKEFDGRKDLIVTKKMKLLISATAIRLTFGYKTDYLINGLDKIIIYPEEYYSNFTKTYNKGETNPQGIVVFSWKDFVEGLNIENDNINLGFHELAHAFIIENINNSQPNNEFDLFYEQLGNAMNQTNLIEEAKNINFFREYAYTNKMEFIACCIETFFESSEDFKNKLPQLYEIICGMLNQDPIKIKQSYC